MKRITILWIILFCLAALCPGQRRTRSATQKIIQLTEPISKGTITFEEALANRQDVQLFSSTALKNTEIGQLAWAGQGVIDSQRGLRTVPPVGNSYPIELFFAKEDGVFHYLPAEHSLEQISNEDIRARLATVTPMQEAVGTAGCNIIVAGSSRRLAGQFRGKARTYMLLEAGYVIQNILLQAVCLDLGAVAIGDFNTQEVNKICRLSRGLEIINIISVGYTREQAAEKGQASSKRAALIVPSQNFQDEELFETKRALDEAAVQSVIVSSRTGIIRGALGNITEANVLIGQLRMDDYDAIIFIGGLGAAEYFTHPAALNLAREAVRQRKIVAASSIAPAILANAGVLTGVRATSFISERNRLIQGGAIYTGIPVEQDKLIITSSGPAASIQFARAVTDALIR